MNGQKPGDMVAKATLWHLMSATLADYASRPMIALLAKKVSDKTYLKTRHYFMQCQEFRLCCPCGRRC